MKVRRVVTVNPIMIPESSTIRREAPRVRELRQADYDKRFDNDTLAYDVFSIGQKGRVQLCGPPLLNLAEAFKTACWFIDGSPALATLSDLDRTQYSWLSGQASGGEELTFIAEDFRTRTKISPSGLSFFHNRRVLTTKSKNNDLKWISDWAKFHAIKHGVDAVLLYDNGSDNYTPADVLSALDHPELDVVIVVDWPFKFGPQGGRWDQLKDAPWDSDFCEYGILEHARRRFLSEADGVISHDIDELVLTSNNQTIFEVIDESEAGYIRYPGRWIENITTQSQEKPQFTDFFVYSTERSPSTVKWALDPRRTSGAQQWKTHGIASLAAPVKTEQVMHRHFMGINTNWKWKRDKPQRFNAKLHERDSLLIKQLSDVFGDKLVDVAAVVSDASMALEHAHKLELLLAPSKRLNDGFQRTWYYKVTTLVLEYVSIQGVRYAFDIIFSDDSVRMQITARDDVAWYSILKLCSHYGRSVKKSRSLQIIEWKNFDLEEIARDVIAHVQRVNTALNYQSIISPRAIASYWWDMKSNFGDLIGPWILEELTGRPVYNTIGQLSNPDACMTVGSLITEMQRPGMKIWGAGLIAPLSVAAIKRLKSREPEAILAVRGKHARSQLMSELGWKVPEVYGDPALLMPYLFQPAIIKRPLHRSGLSVIPHYSHKAVLTRDHIERCGGYFIEVQRQAEQVVTEIALSDVVISTSLHGIVLAQAYEIPWVWLRITDKVLAGDEFKFEDFFTVLEREQVTVLEVSVDELKDLDLAEVSLSATIPKSYFEPLKLVQALPFQVREEMMNTLKAKFV